MEKSLPVIPKVVDGKRIFSVRCATCADVRPVSFTEKGSPTSGLICSSPQTNQYSDEEGIFPPPTGQIVQRFNYCGVWRKR